MKRILGTLLLLALGAGAGAGACACACASSRTQGWQLSWEENFDTPQVDTSVWSRIPRGTAAWQDTQSSDDRCYSWRDGRLVLRGIVNDDRTANTAAYLTGGLWTKCKHAFFRGRIEIRAKLQGARGA